MLVFFTNSFKSFSLFKRLSSIIVTQGNIMLEPSNNWLSVYGAFVGTLALAISAFQYRHAKRKDLVQLSVECEQAADTPTKIKAFIELLKGPEMDKPHLEEIYTVTVRNIGNVDAYIQEVGVRDRSGASHTALVRTSHFLAHLEQAPQICIKSKARQKFKIYLGRDQEIFTATSCFVVDQQQKSWEKKVKFHPILI